MTDNANPQDLIALLRTFIGDTQIVRAAREAADLIEQQADRMEVLERERDEAIAAEEKVQELHDRLANGAEPYAYVYEWDTMHGLGVHRDFQYGSYNGRYPDRTVKVYAAPVADSAMAKDAERYRWLREQNADSAGGWAVVEDTEGISWDQCWVGDDLDESIDAAIAAKESANG